MTTKLTLSMDKSVIARAKQAAHARNTSVSAMLAELVRGLDALDHAPGQNFIGPITMTATGLARPVSGSSDVDLLADALWERYGDAG